MRHGRLIHGEQVEDVGLHGVRVVERGYLRHGVWVVGCGGLVGLVVLAVPVVPLVGVEGVEGLEVGEESAHGALEEVLVFAHGSVAAAGLVSVVVGEHSGDAVAGGRDRPPPFAPHARG